MSGVRSAGGQGGCERRIEVIVKMQKRWGVNEKIEATVKMQKCKKKVPGWGSGRGPVGGGGSGWM